MHWTRDLLQQYNLTEDVNLQDKEKKVPFSGQKFEWYNRFSTLCGRRDGQNRGSIPIHKERLMVWLDIQGFRKILIGGLVISISRGSFQSRDQTRVSHTAGRFFTV